jgi:peptidoglycan/LPS O-acetylase OafA/YrhL/CubicO group peptidase (beta-lactamase class C family)
MAADRGSQQNATSLAYLPGLDGLRALAVIAVMLYHAGYQVAGGYLGVESFFVLSGFLITALLVAEWQQHGQIHITRFWLRRARRLLPALFVMLAGTLLISAILLPGELQALSGDTLAALLYVMNWKLVIGQQSYFDALDRPSLLQHLWSLAVEEQFYLLWPLLFPIGMRLLRPLGFLIAVIVAVCASAALMIGLYDPGSDPSRIYYGTDTRVAAMLIGAALAFVWTPERRSALRRPGFVLEGGGIAALVGLLVAYVWLYEQHPLLYYGGFQLVALATAALIVATTYPGARILPTPLEAGPLRWIGIRSYSLYLWHWPVLLVVRSEVAPSLQGWSLGLAYFGITIALAALSYRFIERPIRVYGAAGAWNRLGGAVQRATRLLVPRWRAISIALCALLPAIVASLLMLRLPSAQPVALTASTPVTTARRAATRAPTSAANYRPAANIAPHDADADAAPIAPEPSADTTQAAVGRVALPPLLPTPSPLPTEPTLDPALIAELQHLLDETVADGFVPGAVLSVSVPGYAQWNSASGFADHAQGLPMAPTTAVRIASVSKMFTAVVVLQLVEEGSISLDTPIGAWLPDSVPRADSITVRQLLQHTSGLYDYLEDRNFIAQTQREPDRIWQPQELVDYATGFPAGALGRWDYSSTNYVLLGMLVERVTGQPLAQQIRQRIFEPLDMHQAAFLPQEPVPETLAHGYTRGTDITNASMSFAFATANIAMTVGELQHFGRALFTEELLRAETRDVMWQFVSGRGQYDMPALEYGLGVMRNRLPIGPAPDDQPRAAQANLVLGHIGGYGGFRSALWYAPDSGVVIAVGLNQAHTDPNQLATAVLDRLLAEMGDANGTD